MTSTTILQPPRTIKEVWENLPEGTRAQVVENQLIMSPPPLDKHQKTLNNIVRPLLNYLEENPIGEIRIAPYGVYLDKENVFEPDISFISKENLYRIEESGLHGPPDLVIEILSPSTARYDRKQKKNAYERHGVKEYWIIDPQTKEVQGFFLMKGQFESQVQLKGRIASRVLDYDFGF